MHNEKGQLFIVHLQIRSPFPRGRSTGDRFRLLLKSMFVSGRPDARRACRDILLLVLFEHSVYNQNVPTAFEVHCHDQKQKAPEQKHTQGDDCVYTDTALDAIVCDVNQYHAATEKYGRPFCNLVLRSIGISIRKLARKTGGIGCRYSSNTFLLYCPHQDDYEQLLRDFMTDVFAEKETADKVSLRFGVYVDAQQEADVEERFVRAITAADSVKGNPDVICGFV